MKKYVNAKNVIGLILGLLAIVVFCILKHPVWAILIGITTTVAFWVPNSKILDWVKAGLVTVAIGMTIYTIMQVEPIHTSIANAFPAFSGFYHLRDSSYSNHRISLGLERSRVLR